MSSDKRTFVLKYQTEHIIIDPKGNFYAETLLIILSNKFNIMSKLLSQKGEANMLAGFNANIRWYLANGFNEDLIVLLSTEMVKRGISMGAISANIKMIKKQLGIKEKFDEIKK